MTRIKKIFLAFTGPEINQEMDILEIHDGYEYWDLKKFTLKDFVKKIKTRIPPAHSGIPEKNYSTDQISNPWGITEKHYEQCSWGLFLPETIEDSYSAANETLFLLNLYSPMFMYPHFAVNDIGITRLEHKKEYFNYWHYQDAKPFLKKDFVTFYKKLLPQSVYSIWEYNRVQNWDKEDWRLFVASNLFLGLKDYENSKHSFEWQRESAEIATILESLFTAGDTQNEEVIYRLKKRISIILYKHFPEIEKELKTLYKARCSFVHGSFFSEIAKKSKSDDIPVPDFNMLYKHKECARWALIGYLYLANITKNDTNKYQGKNVMQLIEESILNVELRKTISEDVENIFTLLPPLNNKMYSK
jgi:hypothetical protein